MRVVEARVIERRPLAPVLSGANGPGLVLLWLSAPVVSRGARPGQFVMVHPTGTLDPFLPRALWIHRLRDGEDGEELALLVDVVGRGTALIADAVPGQHLTITGPLGRPLTVAPGVRSLLLVAGGIGVAPLVWCADEETRRGRSVTLLLGAATAARLYPPELLDPEVEVAVATEDGSAGSQRNVADLVGEYAGWADAIIAGGPNALYRQMAETLRGLLWRRACRVLANVAMPCGTGVCGACVLATRRKGTRLACRDGASFDLRDLW